MTETTQQPTTDAGHAPALPPELWLLRARMGTWVPSIDDARGGATYLAAFSETEAKAAAEHQNELYDLHCWPVRVWPPEEVSGA